MDELREIIVKYSTSSHIILVGDLNAYFHRDQPLVRDKNLQTLLEDTNMVLSDSYPDEYTYIHGKGKSLIDYIIVSNKEIINDICVITDSNSNTLPHHAVAVNMLHIPTGEVITSCSKSIVRKVNWNKLDRDKYESVLAERLSTVKDTSDIDEKVGQITAIATSTALECAPQKKQKPKNCKKFCCPELVKLTKNSKKAFGYWEKVGRPVDPHCNLLLVKNSAKKKKKKKA